jgi:hypothetical protein
VEIAVDGDGGVGGAGDDGCGGLLLGRGTDVPGARCESKNALRVTAAPAATMINAAAEASRGNHPVARRRRARRRGSYRA